MTRFARAKGSKSSNERLPESATNWSEMKQQLLEKNEEIANRPKQQNIEKQRQQNYDIFLNELEDKKTKEIKWAEFPIIKKSQKLTSKNKKKISKEKLSKELENLDGNYANVNKNITEIHKNTPKIEKLHKNKSEVKSEKKTKDNNKSSNGTTLKKLKKKNDNPEDFDENPKQMKKIKMSETTITNKKSGKNPKKSNNKNTKIENNEKKKSTKKFEKINTKPITITNTKSKNENSPKEMIKKPKRRKPPPPTTTNIGDKQIELELFDGFPIKKEDAKQLKTLKLELINRGIPQSEIKRTIKLERRRAEKTLAREKRRLCFNCRQSGHILSECPTLTNQKTLYESTTTIGICFKCGSTEHQQSECHQNKNNENFKYAKCFICNEQGHISKQCPDNPYGLYPNGGSCKECGDVTHLKKNCPKFIEKQHINEIHCTILDNDNPDNLEQNTIEKQTKQISKKKLIKF